MNIKVNLFNFSLSILSLLIICSASQAATWSTEFYSQNVFLYKYDDPLTQDLLIAIRDYKEFEAYGGVWMDYDGKSDAEVTYTDAQISPLIGARTKPKGWDWLCSRVFAETRFVYRIIPFPDNRPQSTYDIRGGLMGYGIKLWDERWFIENYYALFYTRLYDKRVIFQGWAKQGLRFFSHWDIFNEIFADTFDMTRGNDGTLDWRPGIRYRYDFKGGSLQLIQQRIYHFTNIDYSGRNESRSTVVLGFVW